MDLDDAEKGPRQFALRAVRMSQGVTPRLAPCTSPRAAPMQQVRSMAAEEHVCQRGTVSVAARRDRVELDPGRHPERCSVPVVIGHIVGARRTRVACAPTRPPRDCSARQACLMGLLPAMQSQAEALAAMTVNRAMVRPHGAHSANPAKPDLVGHPSARIFWLSVAGSATLIGAMTLVLAPTGDPPVGYLALAAPLVAIVAIGAASESDWLGIWTFGAVSVLVGAGIRAAAMVVGWPVGSEQMRDFFQLNQLPTELVPAALWASAFAALAVTSYLLTPSGRQFRWQTRQVAAWRVVTAALLAWIMGMVATADFVRSTRPDEGLQSLLSAKRTTVSANLISQGTDTGYASHGIEREVAGLALVAFAILLAYWTRRGRRPTQIEIAVLVVMAAGATVQPIYASERADVMMLFVAIIAILALNGHRLARRHLLLAVAGAILALTTLSVLRGVEVGKETSAPVANAETIADAVLMNRNFADLSKTLLIIDETGDKLEPREGASYLSWIIAPVPRAVWESKPLIHDGPTVGTRIYGTARAGVPPGVIAESYWNFGPGGLVAVALLVGFLVKWMYGYFRPRSLQATWSGSVLYVLGPLQLFQGMLGIGLGAALFRFAVNSTFVLLIVLAAGALPRAESGLGHVHR